jgi:hypothetical protein
LLGLVIWQHLPYSTIPVTRAERRCRSPCLAYIPLRGLIPEIIILIAVLGILAIPETNLATHPGTEGIVGVTTTSAALATMMILFNTNHSRLR